MSGDRALVFPGLVPLTGPELAAILGHWDEHLELAARICRFDPAKVEIGGGSASLPSNVHEALLAVALIRRTAGRTGRWIAFGGLSAGCLPALLAAGVITVEACFELIQEINVRQIEAKTARPNGVTLALLPASEGDAQRIADVMSTPDDQPWLSVDLGNGLIALSFRSTDVDLLRRRLARLGVAILDVADRAEHCPWAYPAEQEWGRILAGVDFRPATAAVISPCTGKRVDDTPEAYRLMLTEQWFGTASLPRLVDGLIEVGVAAVDLVAPGKSVYVTRMRALLSDRADHDLLTVATGEGLAG
ncbi:hypothetical protein [Nonomuraea candida]|uniref:hypothetical protein n=1 Tax=Nonomuraea candida TaxID=359159 RepID=UPI000AD31443|nr:hypothetical protein [Nonomuraea candida]